MADVRSLIALDFNLRERIIIKFFYDIINSSYIIESNWTAVKKLNYHELFVVFIKFTIN